MGQPVFGFLRRSPADVDGYSYTTVIKIALSVITDTCIALQWTDLVQNKKKEPRKILRREALHIAHFSFPLGRVSAVGTRYQNLLSIVRRSATRNANSESSRLRSRVVGEVPD